jgi:arylformamidase
MRIHDITPTVSPRLAVFPGDTPFSRQVAMDFRCGDHLALSAITTTLHIGAHCDAPSHYAAEGQSIDRRDLTPYLGPAQVLTVHVPVGTRIEPVHLSSPVLAPRLLLRTDSFADPETWRGDFVALSAAVVDPLAAQGVILVGVDTPSVDLAEDKALEAHQAIHRHGLAILEGIVLADVPDGLYTLVALPLKIEGAEAAPCRAVLVEGRL